MLKIQKWFYDGIQVYEISGTNIVSVGSAVNSTRKV